MTGLWSAVRLAWRRNRVFWSVWVIALAVLLPATVTKYADIIPEGVDASAFLAQLGGNPTMRAILGPVYDLSSAGPFTMWRVGTFTAAAAAMMSVLGVIRATRAEEEEGRTEVLLSGPVARRVPLAAAVIVALLANLVLALLVLAGMAAADTPVAGALACGAAIGMTGAIFTGVGAVAAQVFESARTARSWSLGAVLGGLYLFRAMVDAAPDSSTMQLLRWVNPIEWAPLIQPYVGNRWWVVGLQAALTVVLLGIAFALEHARDLGAGMVHTKPGRADGAGHLTNAWGLAWRLQRGGIIGWTVGILIAAVGMGSLSVSMDKMLEGQDNVAEMFRKMGGGAPVLKDAFYQAMLGIMATIIALCAVLIISRLRSEEQRGHAEQVLATATSRWSFAGSHLSWALGLPAALLVATGALMPLVDQSRNGGDVVADITKASLAMLPGLLLVVGLAMLLIGWAPRLMGVVWGVLGWTMFVSWIGPLFDIPDWLLKLHPWGHLPHLPSDELTWTAIVVETIVGLLLLALGLVGYRRRNVPA